MLNGNIPKLKKASDVILSLMLHQQLVKTHQLMAFCVRIIAKVMVAKNILKSTVGFMKTINDLRLAVNTSLAPLGAAAKSFFHTLGVELDLRGLYWFFLALHEVDVSINLASDNGFIS